ncbi:proteasome-type protease [Nisaea sp.]|uniref:proteasome-type protease n=1 Tax=Nisaea sp. TaxID=2024842 RepID=UPI00329A65CF
MTYCVGLRLEKGLVFMSDTRTNSGVDNISRFKKLFTWSKPGERVITMMTAGNLATTQTVVSLLDERAKAPEDRSPSILDAPSMFDVARQVGALLREVIRTASPTGERADSTFDATIILGGQIRGGGTRLFLIYPEGNFLEASEDTPFFQIGETKYGRPIILRAFEQTMTYEQAVKLLLVSFDSTIKANLSVGLPLDLMTYEEDSFEVSHERRITADDPYYLSVSQGWGDALKNAFTALPDFRF